MVTNELTSQPPVKEGDVLAGKYRVERVLGEGAMGVVVAAMHVHLGERVALKFLKQELASSQEVVARFLREAQSAVRIKGEHIARVSDVGTLDTGAPYMVMEYLTGSDLGDLVEKRGKFDVATACDCVIQACDALAEAHALGIVHRDLKPSNLFLTKRPDGSPLVKVLDFGVAKLLNNDPSKPQLTANGAVIGSPVYMSPEQLLGKKTVDARSDVWQLGVILHELLTGDCPFDGRTMAEIMLAIGVNPAKPLRQMRPDAPAELEAIILRCLEKDADKRMPDVAALAEGLLPFAANRRAHVSVEHIVTLVRGAQAAANLPPMRSQLQSAPNFQMDRLSEVPGGVQVTTKEPSNPFQQTVVSVNPPAPAVAALAVPQAPAVPQVAQPAADSRYAQTNPGQLQAQAAASKSATLQWVVAALLVALGVGLAAWGFASRSQGQAPTQKPASTITK